MLTIKETRALFLRCAKTMTGRGDIEIVWEPPASADAAAECARALDGHIVMRLDTSEAWTDLDVFRNFCHELAHIAAGDVDRLTKSTIGGQPARSIPAPGDAERAKARAQPRETNADKQGNEWADYALKSWHWKFTERAETQLEGALYCLIDLAERQKGKRE